MLQRITAYRVVPLQELTFIDELSAAFVSSHLPLGFEPKII
mgnify:CR=1 FL=1